MPPTPQPPNVSTQPPPAAPSHKPLLRPTQAAGPPPLTSTKRDNRRLQPPSDSDVDSAYDDKGSSSNYTSKRPSPATNEHQDLQARFNLSPVSTPRPQDGFKPTQTHLQGLSGKYTNGSSHFLANLATGTGNLRSDLQPSSYASQQTTVNPAIHDATTVPFVSSATNKPISDESKNEILRAANLTRSSSSATSQSGAQDDLHSTSSYPASNSVYCETADNYGKFKKPLGLGLNSLICREDVSLSVLSNVTDNKTSSLHDSERSTSRTSVNPTLKISRIANNGEGGRKAVDHDTDTCNSLSASEADGQPLRLIGGHRQLESTRLTLDSDSCSHDSYRKMSDEFASKPVAWSKDSSEENLNSCAREPVRSSLEQYKYTVYNSRNFTDDESNQFQALIPEETFVEK